MSYDKEIKKLEKNRFSIITNNLNMCYLCGRKKDHLHEVFFGKNRINSMKYGCVVPLCSDCHHKVHCNINIDRKLKKMFQRKFEEMYDIDFLKIFRRNYL